MKIINGKTFRTAGEAAELVGIHRLTLLRWIREKRLSDASRDRNGWRLFSEEDVQQIIEYAQSVNTRSSPAQRMLFPTTKLPK